ncbi:hypothetical protein ElyMa_005086700 [Elysia marginata]|uniref:Neogenin C-terminal domain-containing protein n=1 Tax=Elysia marginata TaxID=1093978 RepID=A0AAV4JH24_9GAST|nr:hypothetical protein ElyMa_005086700 [Elysia marginata]
MASLQSSRMQCCCCAIGVFAAMFGVFMLSAGICIVVNVGMEVDTSGLPSNLHNDDGRKIIGIILICVAVATMALSASVGFFYFVVCNRKPQHSSSEAVAASRGNGRSATAGDAQQTKHRHHGHHHHHGASRGVNGVLQHRSGGAGSPADGRHARLAQPERTRSRDSVRTGSQQSLRSAVAGAIGDSPVGGGNRAVGRPPGSRYHHKRSHHKSRGFRPNVSRYKSGLEPHQEEDVEAAKSVVDLKRTLASGSSSSAIMSQTTDPRRHHSHQAWSDEYKDETDLEKTSSFSSPPTIILSNTMDSQPHLGNTDDSFTGFNNSSNTMETQILEESGSMTMLGNTLNSTADFASPDSTLNEEFQQRQIMGGKSEFEEVSFSQGQLPSHGISSSHSQAGQHSGSTAAKHSLSSMSSASSVSMSPSHSSSVNLVTDAQGAFHTQSQILSSVSSEVRHVSDEQLKRRENSLSREVEEVVDLHTGLESEQRHRSHKRHHHKAHKDKEKEQNSLVGDGETEIQLTTLHVHQATRRDPVPLPSFSQERLVDIETPTFPKGQGSSGSVSKDNHAFSSDGGDPDADETADLHKMREYMKDLMDETRDV